MQDGSSNGKQPVTLPERYGEGDTYLVLDILPDDVGNAAFEDLKKEVKWNTMSHHGNNISGNPFKGSL